MVPRHISSRLDIALPASGGTVQESEDPPPTAAFTAAFVLPLTIDVANCRAFDVTVLISGSLATISSEWNNFGFANCSNRRGVDQHVVDSVKVVPLPDGKV